MSSPPDLPPTSLIENIGAGITAKNRFWTTVAAQTGGLILLFILGVLVFPRSHPNIDIGLDFIRTLIIVYIFGSLLGGFLPAIIAFFKEDPEVFKHSYVDFSVWTFVWLDMNILLLLVCQEGGLSHSVFLPVFLLIPIAYVPVERADKRYRAMVILGTTIVYMVITYYMSDRSHLNLWAVIPVILLSLVSFVLISAEKYRKRYRYAIILAVLIVSLGLPYLARDNSFWPAWTMTVTDFHAHAHAGFDRAIFWASLLSALIPFTQVMIILFQNRKIRMACPEIGAISQAKQVKLPQSDSAGAEGREEEVEGYQ